MAPSNKLPVAATCFFASSKVWSTCPTSDSTVSHLVFPKHFPHHASFSSNAVAKCHMSTAKKNIYAHTNRTQQTPLNQRPQVAPCFRSLDRCVVSGGFWPCFAALKGMPLEILLQRITRMTACKMGGTTAFPARSSRRSYRGTVPMSSRSIMSPTQTRRRLDTNCLEDLFNRIINH